MEDGEGRGLAREEGRVEGGEENGGSENSAEK